MNSDWIIYLGFTGFQKHVKDMDSMIQRLDLHPNHSLQRAFTNKKGELLV